MNYLTAGIDAPTCFGRPSPRILPGRGLRRGHGARASPGSRGAGFAGVTALCSVFSMDLPLSLWRRKEPRELIRLHLVARIYVRSGDRVAEIVEDGENLAFSDLAKAAVQLTSADAVNQSLFGAEVNPTEAS